MCRLMRRVVSVFLIALYTWLITYLYSRPEVSASISYDAKVDLAGCGCSTASSIPDEQTLRYMLMQNQQQIDNHSSLQATFGGDK